MTEAAIPFIPSEQAGWEEIAGASPLVMNIVVDGRGAVRRRPGISTYSGAPSTVIDSAGIQGIHATQAGNLPGKLYAVAADHVGRPVYLLSAGGATNLSAVPLGWLAGSERPVFAETEQLLIIATGDLVQKVDRDTNLSSRLGGDPPLASHVIANSSRLLLNDVDVDRTKVSFSSPASGTDISGHEQWAVGIGLAGFFTAESRPDPVAAIHETTNEVFVFGTGTLQIYGPDVEPFVYTPSNTREYGLSATYSVIKTDQQFAWLDQYRRFILSDGRTQSVLSDPIKQVLEGMETVSDCFGYRVVTGPADCLVWTFPTDGRSFCFQKGSGWSQWSGWDDGTNNWAAMPVTAHHLRTDTGENIVGTSDGHIGMYTFETQTDLGGRINAYIATGFHDYGTDKKKHAVCAKLILRRGESSEETGPIAWFAFKDQPGPWGQKIPVELGGAGEREVVLEFRSLGTFRRRAWLFEFSDDAELALVRATLEFEVLDN